MQSNKKYILKKDVLRQAHESFLEEQKQSKKKDIVHMILGTVAVVGAITVASVAPNLLGVFKDMDLPNKRQKKYYIKSKLSKLIDKGYIVVQRSLEGKKYLELTEVGFEKLTNKLSQQLRVNESSAWDKKWRVVIYDIPEKEKNKRSQLRDMLQSIGFIQIQRSVWVYPYDCEELLLLLKTQYKLGKKVLYMTVDTIENDGWVREHFEI